MNHRFKIGDRVRVIGILADLYPGKIATVLAVRPHETGITELDHYVIEIQNVEMGNTTFCDFQLAPTSTLNAYDSRAHRKWRRSKVHGNRAQADDVTCSQTDVFGEASESPNQTAALALYFAFYNFCRIHRTLQVTPAIESGNTDHVWTIQELLEAA